MQAPTPDPSTHLSRGLQLVHLLPLLLELVAVLPQLPRMMNKFLLVAGNQQVHRFLPRHGRRRQSKAGAGYGASCAARCPQRQAARTLRCLLVAACRLSASASRSTEGPPPPPPLLTCGRRRHARCAQRQSTCRSTAMHCRPVRRSEERAGGRAGRRAGEQARGRAGGEAGGEAGGGRPPCLQASCCSPPAPPRSLPAGCHARRMDQIHRRGRTQGTAPHKRRRTAGGRPAAEASLPAAVQGALPGAGRGRATIGAALAGPL
jgi:hypothetical protein